MYRLALDRAQICVDNSDVSEDRMGLNYTMGVIFILDCET